MEAFLSTITSLSKTTICIIKDTPTHAKNLQSSLSRMSKQQKGGKLPITRQSMGK
ncbi:Uncharacterised protein [Mycobacteroides abscessus subsp. abscessus]|nr:Uncharacterised protein [Mycobacteroides abscessus subsp. abscessus]